MSTIPPIRIDPYFDGEADFAQHPQGAPEAELAGRQYALAPEAPLRSAPNRRGTTVAGCDNVQGYRSPDEIQLIGGRSMSAVLNGFGTVIPRSTPAGVPTGVQVHNPRLLEVNIDPHLEGQRARVRLSDINAETLRQATAFAEEHTPDPSTIETLRLRGSTVMRGIAALSQNGPAPVIGGGRDLTERQGPQGYAQQPQLPQQQSQPLGAPAGGSLGRSRTSSPLAAFNQPPQPTYQGREPRHLDIPPAVPRETPRIRATYEIQGFGTHTTHYHDVIRTEGFLVLVYDTNYNGDMYTPPAGEETPSMALQIDQHSKVYLVHSTGISYDYRNWRFCVLLVEREAPMVHEEPIYDGEARHRPAGSDAGHGEETSPDEAGQW